MRTKRDTIAAERGEPWKVRDGLVLPGSRVFVPLASRVLPSVLQLAHTAAHEGIQMTLQRLRRDFIIDNERRVVREFIRTCAICQRNKTEALHSTGLLQPLGALPDLGRYLAGFCGEPPKGQWQECYTDSGGSFLQICTLHRPRTSLHSGDGRPSFRHGHCQVARVSGINC